MVYFVHCEGVNTANSADQWLPESMLALLSREKALCLNGRHGSLPEWLPLWVGQGKHGYFCNQRLKVDEIKRMEP